MSSRSEQDEDQGRTKIQAMRREKQGGKRTTGTPVSVQSLVHVGFLPALQFALLTHFLIYSHRLVYNDSISMY